MDDPTQPENDLLDLPKFLKRDPVTNRAEYMSDTETVTETRKSRPAKTVKANGTAKPKVETKKVKKSPSAKSAKTTKEAKVAKPAKAKAVKAEIKAEKDQYGLRKGSARSEAAAMYARKSGATLAEVKDRVGSIQLNVLTELSANGWVVEKDVEKRDGQRPITRYWLKPAK
jgi:hypothetical protein